MIAPITILALLGVGPWAVKSGVAAAVVAGLCVFLIVQASMVDVRVGSAVRTIGLPYYLFVAAFTFSFALGLAANDVALAVKGTVVMIPLVLIPVAAVLFVGRAGKQVLVVGLLVLGAAASAVVWGVAALSVWRSGSLVERAAVAPLVPDLYILLSAAIGMEILGSSEPRSRWLALMSTSAVLLSVGALLVLSYRFHVAVWLVLVLLGMFRRARRRGKTTWLVVCVMAVAALMALPLGPDRRERTTISTDLPYVERTIARVATIAAVSSPRARETIAVVAEVENFWEAAVGHGFGHEYRFLRIRDGVAYPEHRLYTHNILTYWLLVGGGAGVLALIWFAIVVARRAGATARREQWESRCAFTSLLVCCAFSLFFAGGSSVYVPLTIMLLAGVGVGGERRRQVGVDGAGGPSTVG